MLCLEYLHRHPSEVRLSADAHCDLAAWHEAKAKAKGG